MRDGNFRIPQILRKGDRKFNPRQPGGNPNQRNHLWKIGDSSVGEIESAFASLTIFSRATFCSPRSAPPALIAMQPRFANSSCESPRSSRSLRNVVPNRELTVRVATLPYLSYDQRNALNREE